MEPTQDHIEPVRASEPPPKPVSGLGPISLLRDVAISVALAVILIVFIYQPVKVEGTSMMPGLSDQERIFVNKYEYKLSPNNIHRGDLWSFIIRGIAGILHQADGRPALRFGSDCGWRCIRQWRKLNEPYVPRIS